jgi:DNA modification methylase
MTGPYYTDDQITLWHGDALAALSALPTESVNCVVTSPPYYGLRDYGEPGQYGLEPTPAEYVETMRAVFAEVRRVLAADGTLWLNLGDSYSGSWGNQGRKEERGTQRPINGEMIQPVHDGRYPPTGARTGAIRPGAPPAKNLLGMPWRVAFALQDDGWILRNAIAWHKANAMPESVTDRLSAKHELLFLFVRSPRYWFDLDAIREPLAHPEALDGTRVFGGATKSTEAGIGATARRRGHNTYGATPPGHTGGPKNGGRGTHHDDANPRGRNPGDVWSINTQPFAAAHFAVMPPVLADRCVRAGCRPGGVVLDPFAGSGTTGMVALKHGRRFVGIDLSGRYLDLALHTRLAQGALIEPEGDAA